jgi:peptide deformylase
MSYGQEPPPKFKSPITTDERILRRVSEITTRKDIEYARIGYALKVASQTAWSPAVGLAAIQLGFPVRFAYYEFDITDKTSGAKKHVGPVYLMNPEIRKVAKLTQHVGEGCLSIPNKRYTTWRFDEIEVFNAWDQSIIKAKGFEAFVIQHEIDHMNGGLCCDRTSVGRNDPCPCGSGATVKKCCLI